MTSSTVISSNESWYNGISDDLERIYTSITTPEERVVMEPFKSLFEEINTAIIDGALTLSDTKNNAYRNKCLSWCRRAREASRLLPRHLVIDCGCVVLRVWFRWALRYFSDQISAHCKHIPHVFGELDGSCVALLEGDGTGDSRKLSRDEVMQCAADSCNDVLRLYLDGDGQSLFVLRAAFDDLAQMHGFLDLFCRLGAQLSHQMGVHRADLDGIMDSVFVGYRTHAWIRRWVLLLVGAIHIHSPITAWMNAKDSLFQQWEPNRLMYLAPCWMAFGAFGKLTQRMFEEEKTQVDFVMTVAVIVFNEHMLRFVCPLAEWAVQTPTTSVVEQDDADEMKEADDCMTDNTDDAHTRAYDFLKELNQYVLANTTFMSKCLYGSTMTMDESVIDYFRALVSAYLTRAPTSTDGSNLTNTLLYQLVERGCECTLDHFFRGEAHSYSETATDEDFEASTSEVDEAERDVRTDDVGAKIRRFPDEYYRYEGKIDDSDDAAHVVETLFDIRRRLFLKDTGYPYWQRLFPGSQPRETVELAVRTIEGIFVRSIEIYLMQVYSASPRDMGARQRTTRRHCRKILISSRTIFGGRRKYYFLFVRPLDVYVD